MNRIFSIALAVILAIVSVVGCGEEPADIVRADSIVDPYGTVTIHNPSGSDLNLIDYTRLLSPDGKVYRIINKINIPAQGKVFATIVTDDRTDFDLGAGVRLSIPDLSRFEEFKGVIVTTNRQAFG